MKLPTESDAVNALKDETVRKDKEADQTEKVMAQVAKDQAGKLADAQAVLEKKREEAARLKAQVSEVRAAAAAAERRRLEGENASLEACRTGSITAAAFLEKYIPPAEIERRAGAVAEEKVAPVFQLARASALAALKAEAAVVECQFEIAFARSAPAQARLEAEKARLKEVDGVAGMTLGALAVAANRRQDIQRRLDISEGAGFRYGGLQLFNLTAEQLEDLAFDPVITADSLPALAEVINKVRGAGPNGQVATLVIKYDGTFGTTMMS